MSSPHRMPRALFLLLLSLVSGLVACATTESSSMENGVQHLFDGHSLNGWSLQVGEGASPDGLMRIEDGVLICRGEPTAVLRTTKEFENYELLLEWRWAPGKEAGNSGLLLHCSTPAYRDLWPRSVEAQLKTGSAAGLYLMGEGVDIDINGDRERRSGSWIPRFAGSEKSVGEWNQMRVVCIGDRITVFLNGVLANEGFSSSETRGAIALQSEGAEIHFRRVDLRTLTR